MKKKNRVRKAQEFQTIIKNGKKHVNRSFVFYAMPKADDEARIGISLSKKIGNAVARNLYKRQVRMMCQELIDFQTLSIDGILIVRFGYKELSYQQNKNNLEKLINESTI